MTELEIILIGLMSGLCMMGWLFGIYTATPLIYAFCVGLILGDVKTALVVGSSAQILWLGFGMGTGGVRPPDPIAPGVLGTIIAIIQQKGQVQLISIANASSIVGLTFAFGILVQFLLTFLLTAMSPVAQMAKKAAEKGHFIYFKILSSSTITAVGIIGFILGIISASIGEPLAETMKSFPEWLKNSLKVVGGLLPALGFALIMSVMLKKEFIAYLFVGYVLLVLILVVSKQMNLKYSLMLLAFAALGIALIVVTIEQKIIKQKTILPNSGGQNGI